jgi:glucose-1-phosphate cytidylyltransferase
VKHLLEDGPFLCTYGDGLADIKLGNLISFHSNHAGIATVTAVNPPSRFGAVDLNNDNRVTTFEEKPGLSHWINGGFFIFESRIFELIEESSSLEQEVLPQLARSNELWAYKHEGFWRPMDTIRETKELNEIFVSGNAPWKTW